MSDALETLETHRCFGGTQGFYQHRSKATGTPMRFSVYLPPQAEKRPVPVLYYLSGLTCTADNVTTKGGAQRYCAEHGLAFVAPDTSPRGADVPDDAHWGLGQGAGFYLDATQAPWSTHFKMATYTVDELPALVNARFAVDADRWGLTGHSMGGHGALTLALKHPDRFRSLSGISAIVAASQVEWGREPLRAYLGDDAAAWAEHDACALLRARGWPGDVLLDQGEADGFLDGLRPELFEAACAEAGVPLTLRRHAGYDHSYYFVGTVIGDHVAWHAERLYGP